MELIAAFPQLRHSRRCLSFLLRVFEQLGGACEAGVPLPACVLAAFADCLFCAGASDDLSLDLPGTTFTISLPSDHRIRWELLRNYADICKHWLTSAMAAASMETRGILHVCRLGRGWDYPSADTVRRNICKTFDG